MLRDRVVQAKVGIKDLTDIHRFAKMVVFIRHQLYKYIKLIVIGHGLLVNFSCQLLKVAAQLMIKMNSHFKRSRIII